MDNGIGPAGFGASIADLVSTIKGAVQNLSALNQTLSAAFPRATGTVTLSAATTTLVTQTAIIAGSIVSFVPTNATAALILRTNGLYHSSNVVGASFTLTTQVGSATAGGTFEYYVVNPV